MKSLSKTILDLLERSKHPDSYHFDRMVYHRELANKFYAKGDIKKAMENVRIADKHAAVLNRKLH